MDYHCVTHLTWGSGKWELVKKVHGTGIYTLEKLIGHEGLTLLQRYLKQTYQHTEPADRCAGLIENS
jgi:hypothetical protein